MGIYKKMEEWSLQVIVQKPPCNTGITSQRVVTDLAALMVPLQLFSQQVSST